MSSSHSVSRAAGSTAQQPRHAYVLGGNRLPFAKVGGAYADASNQDMLTAALDGLIARYNLGGEILGEVAAGAVLKRSKDFNLTRESVLSTALDPRTSAVDVQKACATGIEAMSLVSNKIRLGQIDSAIAGGVDSASDAPIEVSDQLRRTLHRFTGTSSPVHRARLAGSLRPSAFLPQPPGPGEPRTGLSMGEHQAITTRAWAITRDEQDQLAFESHMKLAQAYDSGLMDELMTGYHGLSRDEYLRPDTSLERLASLRTVFGREDATMTAGNSTGLTDGASAVLIGSLEWARQHSITPLAKIVDVRSAAVDFVHGSEGLLMAPVYAMPRLLGAHNLSFRDIDFFEIHEAFAATVLATMRAWESEEFSREHLGLSEPLGSIDRRTLNVAGSSLATGHPFAATGGRIIALLATLVHRAAVESGETKRGVASVCAASGQGVVALVEADPAEILEGE